ncbi:hypothetical protein ABIE65_004773 [Constrictibacter sp. MBR-5]|uniref:hypothetical protein n=1 Tax=Constrictibacter sp. MBR-5 TaxID=3156467 RepID=UPI00339335B4
MPVIELAGLSEAERRAYILADNRLALNAGWDQDLLAAEVADLDALGVDLSLAGFAESEIGTLLDHFRQGGSFADEAPAPPVDPVSRAGDLWCLGEHRLLCGDALKSEDVQRVLGGVAGRHGLHGSARQRRPQGVGKRRIANDALGDGFGAFLQTACAAFVPLTKGAIYICMSSPAFAALKACLGLQVDAVDLRHLDEATGPGAARIEVQFPALAGAAGWANFGGKTIRNLRCAAVLLMA